jgi:hypothetical protein
MLRVKDPTTAFRCQNGDTPAWSHPIEKNTPHVADDLHFLGRMTLPQTVSKEHLWH